MTTHGRKSPTVTGATETVSSVEPRKSSSAQARFRIFEPILAGATFRARVLACFGAMLAISVTSVVCARLHGVGASLPLLVAPIGASAVLLFAVPASPLAQPWAIVGGNVVSALVGVTAVRLIADPAIAAGVAVGGAIFAMSLLRCLHPPGGAAALTAVIGGPAVVSAGYLFPFLPIGVNSMVLVAIGWLFHRLSGHSYPHPVASTEQTRAQSVDAGFHSDAVVRALADLGETFDITREDIDALLERAEVHQRERAAGRTTRSAQNGHRDR